MSSGIPDLVPIWTAIIALSVFSMCCWMASILA
jgi:hypothetical protein